MPLTAYSITHSGEHDVEQILKWFSPLFGQPSTGAEAISDALRDYLRTDLQCPCCFVTGAEIVRSAIKSGNAKRQSYFRFTTPGHKTHCDFDSPETANALPENLVSLTQSKSLLTRAIRELVCTGIEIGIFNQNSIRDMREWFFNKKIASLFVVTLHPHLYTWISSLQKAVFSSQRALPEGVILTSEIAGLPQFDWSAEAARRVIERYPQHHANMRKIFDQQLGMFGEIGMRAESLAKQFQGRYVFDPTVLADEYSKTVSLANFIGHNYTQLKNIKDSSGTSSVLALSALLLFIRGWDVSLAVSDFAKIVASVGKANLNLGNVMGLNPFHDYEAWRLLKRMQELNIKVPENIDVKVERVALEADLRRQFGAPPVSTESQH